MAAWRSSVMEAQPTRIIRHNGISIPPPPTPPHARRHRRGVESRRQCVHCGRTFKRTEHLERHVRIHTKEKPFVCICGDAFPRRDLLTRHQRISSHEGSLEPRSGLSPVSPERPDGHGSVPALLPGTDAGRWTEVDRQPQPLGLISQVDALNGATPNQGEEGAAQPYFPGLLGPQLFDTNKAQDVMEHDHFREFANFLDGVGLPAEWSPYFQLEAEVDETPSLPIDESRAGLAPTPVRQTGPSRPGSPFSCWLPSAPGVSRISVQPTDKAPRADWGLKVSDDLRTRLLAALSTFRDVVSTSFKLPSRHALTRYITSFFEGFHSHMAFIHHTWRPGDAPLELVLAVSAVGAQYCFERRNAEQLFYAGNAVLVERLRYEADSFGSQTKTFLNLHGRGPSQNRAAAAAVATPDDWARPQNNARRHQSDPAGYWGAWEPIDAVRTLIVLMGYGTWELKETLLREAFSLQTLLVHVLRDVGLEEEDEEGSGLEAINSRGGAIPAELHAAWLEWIRRESKRRAKLIAFSFLHIHSVAYNVYPVLRSNEIRLRLPQSTGEWKAATAARWQDASRETRNSRQLLFQDALSLLLRNLDSTAPLDPIPTPLGNYVLLHGLLQRIYIVRDLSLPVMDQSGALPRDEVEKLERGLRSWTAGWQQAPESSLDPNNENGPIPFTSSALLALAYIRIYLDLGPYRQLESRDPDRIAEALARAPAVRPGDGVISALLYATHALSIPVRLGVDRVARSQAFFWSVRHSLSGLECAVLLAKWLFALADAESPAKLSDSEDRILHWVRCIVEEAWAVVDFEDEDAEFRGGPRDLGLAVLKIWARFFMGNAQWPFINMIGRSLEKYREILMD